MIKDNSVFSDKVLINAPIDVVWNILVDFEGYSKWNPFCPQIINKALAVGEEVDMQIDLGNGLQQQVEVLERIEQPSQLAWGMRMVLDGEEQLKALRTQCLSAIDENSCEYISEDAFSGTLAKQVTEAMGPAIEKGFNLCAYGLKAYAESQC